MNVIAEYLFGEFICTRIMEGEPRFQVILPQLLAHFPELPTRVQYLSLRAELALLSSCSEIQ